MEKAALRSEVFEILRKTPQTHLHAIENELRHRVEGYDRGDAIVVHEIVWELLVQGVLAPGKNSLNLNLPFVHVTDYGARCLEEGEILAHDPEGYERRLATESGGRLPRVALDSAQEASRAFRAGLYSTSLLLLARASSLLTDALKTLLPAKGRSVNPGDSVSAVREVLGKEDLPSELASRIGPALDEFATLIHLTVDADGAAATPISDRDTALAHLLLFPSQCRFAYDLLTWVESRDRSAKS
jgi:hypothetical protein